MTNSPRQKPIDCELHKTGVCRAPEEGVRGCVFWPFFEMYQKQHDQNAELSHAMLHESVNELRRQNGLLFKIVKGNGTDGLEQRLVRLETRLGVYIVVGGGLAGAIAHFAVVLFQHIAGSI